MTETGRRAVLCVVNFCRKVKGYPESNDTTLKTLGTKGEIKEVSTKARFLSHRTRQTVETSLVFGVHRISL